jgi:prepilin-type N-terminal cleavage/methylation domain-containing protein
MVKGLNYFQGYPMATRHRWNHSFYHPSITGRSGFTLLELAIVLVIVSVVAVGVVAGRQVLRNTEVNAVSNDLARVQKAIARFEQAYGGLPGDIHNASTALPNCGTAACTNGDGDGQLETSNASGVNETRLFWQHLSAAGLIPGRFDAASDAPGSGTLQSNVADQAGFRISENPANQDITIELAGFTGGAMNGGALSPQEAYRLDRQLDDGNPTTGTILAVTGSGGTGNCISGSEYTTGNDDRVCRLSFSIGKKQATGNAVTTAARDTDDTVTTGTGNKDCTWNGTPYTPGSTLNAPAMGSPGYDDFPNCPGDTTGGGKGRLICQRNGEWAPDYGNCTLRTCSPASFPGAAAPVCPSGANPRIGETCSVACAAGYSGETVNITCNNPSAAGNAQYSIPRAPDCRQDCTGGTYAVTGHPTRTVTFPTVADGASSRRDCPTGMSGTGIVRSCSNGSWTTTSENCTPDPCPTQVQDCGSGQNCSFPGVAHNATSTVACPAGYEVNAARSCSYGVWSALSSSCTPMPCTTQSLACGSSQNCSFTAITHGGTRTAACPAGYAGTPQRQCLLGSWQALGGATCTPTCTAPAAPANAGSQSAPSLSGSTWSVNVTCASGYVGGGTRTCTTGAWTSVSCNAACTTPAAPANATSQSAATLSGSTWQSYTTCAGGYNGSGWRTCTTGTWTAASCTPACTTPAAPANASSQSAATWNGSSWQSYTTCAPGYNGSNWRTCTSGAWTTVSCTPATCTGYTYVIPGHPTKSVTFPNTTAGNASYQPCPAGMNGPGYGNVCSQGMPYHTAPAGTWQGQTGSCNPNSCPATTRTLTGLGTVMNFAAQGHGGTSTVNCPAGYADWNNFGGTHVSLYCSYGNWAQDGWCGRLGIVNVPANSTTPTVATFSGGVPYALQGTKLDFNDSFTLGNAPHGAPSYPVNRWQGSTTYGIVTADGLGWGAPSGWAAPGASAHSLVMRIGNSGPFRSWRDYNDVGAIIHPVAGQLQFIFNDCHQIFGAPAGTNCYTDNTGSVTASFYEFLYAY